MNWYLISQEDLEAIRTYLEARADAGDEQARAALYALESGLHTTDAQPADLAEETLSA